MLNRFLEERNVTKSLYIPYMTFDTNSLPLTLISDIHRYIFYMRELLENIKEKMQENVARDKNTIRC